MITLKKITLINLMLLGLGIGIALGYAWRMTQIEPQLRQETFSLLNEVNDLEIKVDALKKRLADAEGRIQAKKQKESRERGKAGHRQHP